MAWIVIGILLLLAVSMLISSKHFRLFFGSLVTVLAALIVGGFAFLFLSGHRSVEAQQRDTSKPAVAESPKRWRITISPEPTQAEVVQQTSETLLEEMRKMSEVDAEALPSDAEIDPNPTSYTDAAGSSATGSNLQGADATTKSDRGLGGETAAGTAATHSSSDDGRSHIGPPVVRRYSINYELTGRDDHDKLALSEKIAAMIEEYLKFYRKHNNDVGVAQLKPENLDWRLLKFRALGVDRQGKLKARLFFDDAFHRHVRERGQQWMIAHRLKTSALAGLGGLAGLTVLLGILKVSNSNQNRRETRDPLLSNGISMV